MTPDNWSEKTKIQKNDEDVGNMTFTAIRGEFCGKLSFVDRYIKADLILVYFYS